MSPFYEVIRPMTGWMPESLGRSLDMSSKFEHILPWRLGAEYILWRCLDAIALQTSVVLNRPYD